MTRSQMLRKLQMAVNHIADVIDHAPSSALPELNEALDLIHQAESDIEEDE